MSDIYPLLLLSREGLTADGQTDPFEFLLGCQPVTVTIEKEKTAGTDSDTCWARFTRGETVTETHGDDPSRWPYELQVSPALNRLLARLWDGESVGAGTGQIMRPGSHDQISWNISGGTWNLNVWLEPSPMSDGRLYQQLDSSNALAELL